MLWVAKASFTMLIGSLLAPVPGDNPINFHSPGGDMFFTVYENDLEDEGDDTIGLDPDEERATKVTSANGEVTWTSASYTFHCGEDPAGGAFYWLEYDNGKRVEMIPY